MRRWQRGSSGALSQCRLKSVIIFEVALDLDVVPPELPAAADP
jgi:hypothetical protein